MADPPPDPQVRRMMRPSGGPACRRDHDASGRAHRWRRGREAGDAAGAAIELGHGTVFDPRLLAQPNGADLATAVPQRLRAEGERGLRLARQIQETALAAGAAAVGLSEVVAARSEARVAVLADDPNVRYQGRLGEDGSSHAVGAARAGAGMVAHEPRLTGPIAARCLRIDARFMLVEGAAADVLGDAGGIAALLRW